MVVLLEDYGARLNEPATLTWDNQTLTRDVQTAYNNGNQRSLAIYHLFNPVARDEQYHRHRRRGR